MKTIRVQTRFSNWLILALIGSVAGACASSDTERNGNELEEAEQVGKVQQRVVLKSDDLAPWVWKAPSRYDMQEVTKYDPEVLFALGLYDARQKNYYRLTLLERLDQEAEKVAKGGPYLSLEEYKNKLNALGLLVLTKIAVPKDSPVSSGENPEFPRLFAIETTRSRLAADGYWGVQNFIKKARAMGLSNPEPINMEEGWELTRNAYIKALVGSYSLFRAQAVEGKPEKDAMYPSVEDYKASLESLGLGIFEKLAPTNMTEYLGKELPGVFFIETKESRKVYEDGQNYQRIILEKPPKPEGGTPESSKEEVRNKEVFRSQYVDALVMNYSSYLDEKKVWLIKQRDLYSGINQLLSSIDPLVIEDRIQEEEEKVKRLKQLRSGFVARNQTARYSISELTDEEKAAIGTLIPVKQEYEGRKRDLEAEITHTHSDYDNAARSFPVDYVAMLGFQSKSIELADQLQNLQSTVIQEYTDKFDRKIIQTEKNILNIKKGSISGLESEGYDEVSSPVGIAKLQLAMDLINDHVAAYKGELSNSEKLNDLVNKLLKIRGYTYGSDTELGKQYISQAQQKIYRTLSQYNAVTKAPKTEEYMAEASVKNAAQFVADKLGEFLTIAKVDRIKLASQEWISFQKHIPAVEKCKDHGWLKDCDVVTPARDETVNTTWVNAFLSDEGIRRMMKDDPGLKKKSIDKLKSNVIIENQSIFDANIEKLFAERVVGLANVHHMDNEVLPSDLMGIKSTYETTFNEDKELAIQEYKEVLYQKYLMLWTDSYNTIPAYKTYRDGQKKANKNPDIDSLIDQSFSGLKQEYQTQIEAFKVKLDKKYEADKLTNFDSIRTKIDNKIQSTTREILAWIPVVGQFTQALTDITNGRWYDSRHNLLMLLSMAAATFPGFGQVVGTLLFLADSGLKLGEAGIDYEAALASKDPRKIRAADEELTSGIAGVFLGGLGVVHAGTSMWTGPRLARLAETKAAFPDDFSVSFADWEYHKPLFNRQEELLTSREGFLPVFNKAGTTPVRMPSLTEYQGVAKVDGWVYEIEYNGRKALLDRRFGTEGKFKATWADNQASGPSRMFKEIKPGVFVQEPGLLGGGRDSISLARVERDLMSIDPYNGRTGAVEKAPNTTSQMDELGRTVAENYPGLRVERVVYDQISRHETVLIINRTEMVDLNHMGYDTAYFVYGDEGKVIPRDYFINRMRDRNYYQILKDKPGDSVKYNPNNPKEQFVSGGPSSFKLLSTGDVVKMREPGTLPERPYDSALFFDKNLSKKLEYETTAKDKVLKSNNKPKIKKTLADTSERAGMSFYPGEASDLGNRSIAGSYWGPTSNRDRINVAVNFTKNKWKVRPLVEEITAPSSGTLDIADVVRELYSKCSRIGGFKNFKPNTIEWWTISDEAKSLVGRAFRERWAEQKTISEFFKTTEGKNLEKILADFDLKVTGLELVDRSDSDRAAVDFLLESIQSARF